MSSTLRIHVTLALILIYFTFTRPTRDTLQTRTLLIESECVDRNSNNKQRKCFLLLCYKKRDRHLSYLAAFTAIYIQDLY